MEVNDGGLSWGEEGEECRGADQYDDKEGTAGVYASQQAVRTEAKHIAEKMLTWQQF